MKKLLSYVGLVLVSAFVLVGCTPKEPEPETPVTPETETNAPVTP